MFDVDGEINYFNILDITHVLHLAAATSLTASYQQLYE
jgi:hypothetical protein